jgi:hypothetical protein
MQTTIGMVISKYKVAYKYTKIISLVLYNIVVPEWICRLIVELFIYLFKKIQSYYIIYI